MRRGMRQTMEDLEDAFGKEDNESSKGIWEKRVKLKNR